MLLAILKLGQTQIPLPPIKNNFSLTFSFQKMNTEGIGT